MAEKLVSEDRISDVSSVSDAAQRRRDQLQVVDRLADVGLALGQQLREGLGVAVQRREALERATEVGHRVGARFHALVAGILERLRAPREQQQEVVARVDVERAEDLVDVDVGARVGDAQRTPVGDRTRRLGAGIEREIHVLEGRARAQQHGRVAVDRRVLLVDVHLDHGLAVLERYATHLTDLHAGDRHRLALPRRHRGGAGKRRVDRVVALAERERRLVLEDVADDGDRCEHQRDDGQEVPPMDADRSSHGPIPVVTWLRFGGALVKQGTLVTTGGAFPGNAGRVPRGWRIALPNSGP